MPFGTITLNDGNKLPTIAYGSGSVNKGTDMSALVELALETGFSHIDTAAAYQNEESVGQGLRESGLNRSDVFVTTKYASGDVDHSVRTSLSRLGLQQLDLYLIHNPRLFTEPIEAVWKKFEKLKEDGLSRSIGVSNFTLDQLQSLSKTATIKPAVNQIELHPYNYAQHKLLLEYCAKEGIVIEAYSSLTPLTKAPGGPVDAPVAAAARRLGIEPSQVILSWVRSKGAVIVTTSSSKLHMEQYLAVADLPPLTFAEISAIDEAGAKGPPSIFRKSQLPAHIYLGLLYLSGLILVVYRLYGYWN